jgi:hypothetical protein
VIPGEPLGSPPKIHSGGTAVEVVMMVTCLLA